MVSEVSTSGWLDKAHGLADEVERWRDYGERERRLSDELFDAFRSAGLLRLGLPRALGGEQVSLQAFVEVIEEVARHDGSAAWNLLICSLGGAFADYLQEPAAREIYANGGVAVGSFAPTGQAVAVPGGYRASGRWGFTSGCHNADWIGGGFLLMEDGQPVREPDGRPVIRLLFISRSECTIHDTWQTMGMRGTGSDDFEVSDVFVPEQRGFSFWQLFEGPAKRPGRAYDQPFLPHRAAPAMAAVTLGIARDAIDSFRAFATTKRQEGASDTLATQHTTHLRVGEAEALVRSSRAYLFDVVRQVDAVTEQSPEEAEELTAAVRLACAHVPRAASQAVAMMFEQAGGSSVYASSRLEKCFRDVHVVNHHVLIAPSNIEMVGQYLLGFGLQGRR